MEFVEHAAESPIARKVKIADIGDYIHITRLDTVDESVLDKQSTYHEAWIRL